MTKFKIGRSENGTINSLEKAETIAIDKQSIKNIISFFENQRDRANYECERWDRETTWGDSERIAVDVEFGRITAFDQALEPLYKLISE